LDINEPVLNSSDDKLIAEVKKGNQPAFGELVSMYQDMVFNTAISIVQNETDAEDITQEVFVQVYQSLDTFQGKANFSTWLYRVVVTKALDHEKKRKRKKIRAVKSIFLRISGVDQPFLKVAKICSMKLLCYFSTYLFNLFFN
jgi:DNA-directed RNA polymerase specialized sigma24 family protein